MIMSMQYCGFCDRNVDTDFNAEHFNLENGRLVCNQVDDSPGVEPGPRLTLDQKMARPYSVEEQGDFSGAGGLDDERYGR